MDGMDVVNGERSEVALIRKRKKMGKKRKKMGKKKMMQTKQVKRTLLEAFSFLSLPREVKGQDEMKKQLKTLIQKREERKKHKVRLWMEILKLMMQERKRVQQEIHKNWMKVQQHQIH